LVRPISHPNTEAAESFILYHDSLFLAKILRVPLNGSLSALRCYPRYFLLLAAPLNSTFDFFTFFLFSKAKLVGFLQIHP
jgi:hypothetical protein